MKIEALRKSGELQSHHWRAARWFSELPPRAHIRRDIAIDCLGLTAYGMNAYGLLDATVSTGELQANPRTLGVLREALNIVARKARIN